jgi:hypothetical protein
VSLTISYYYELRQLISPRPSIASRDLLNLPLSTIHSHPTDPPSLILRVCKLPGRHITPAGVIRAVPTLPLLHFSP